MPAFRNAAQNLQVVLELDAKLTADGVPVVFHDPTLDRTTNCEGAVVDRALRRARGVPWRTSSARPGNDLPTAPAPEPVPISTLAEVLAFAKAEGIGINLEIKNYPTDDEDYDPTPAFANRIMDVVLESGIPAKQVIIQSFTPANLDVAESRMPDARVRAAVARRARTTSRIDVAATNGWDWVSPAWPIDKAYVERAHGQDLGSSPTRSTRRPTSRRPATAGVDALISDDPLMALKTVDTEPANVKLEPLSTKLAKVRRKGKLRVRVFSDEPGTAELVARLKRKVLGTRTVAFDEAGARRVVIRLTRAGRNALEGRDTARSSWSRRRATSRSNRGTARATAPLG